MHDTLSTKGSGSPSQHGFAGQAIRMVGQQELRRDRHGRTVGNAGTFNNKDESTPAIKRATDRKLNK